MKKKTKDREGKETKETPDYLDAASSTLMCRFLIFFLPKLLIMKVDITHCGLKGYKLRIKSEMQFLIHDLLFLPISTIESRVS